MIIQYDKSVDALYICFKKEKIAKTIKMKNRLLVDVDKNGSVVGIELLDASFQIPKHSITEFSFKTPAFQRKLNSVLLEKE